MAKTENNLNLLQFLGPVTILKSTAMIRLSNFDRKWFEDWVVFSKNSFRVLLLGGM